MKGNTLESAFAKAAALKAAAQASASPEGKPLGATKAKAKVGATSKPFATAAPATSMPKALKKSSGAPNVAAATAKPKKKKLAYESDFGDSSEESDKADITLYDDSDVEESDRDQQAAPASDESMGDDHKVINLASDSEAMMDDEGDEEDEDADESLILRHHKRR